MRERRRCDYFLDVKSIVKSLLPFSVHFSRITFSSHPGSCVLSANFGSFNILVIGEQACKCVTGTNVTAGVSAAAATQQYLNLTGSIPSISQSLAGF